MEKKVCNHCGKRFTKSEINPQSVFCSYQCQYNDLAEQSEDWGQYDFGYM